MDGKRLLGWARIIGLLDSVFNEGSAAQALSYARKEGHFFLMSFMDLIRQPNIDYKCLAPFGQVLMEYLPCEPSAPLDVKDDLTALLLRLDYAGIKCYFVRRYGDSHSRPSPVLEEAIKSLRTAIENGQDAEVRKLLVRSFGDQEVLLRRAIDKDPDALEKHHLTKQYVRGIRN